MSSCSAPIGVFDSGIGGLSVLRALLRSLPQERFEYVADTAHAPYGEKESTYIQTRTFEIAHFLRHQRGCKALVIACNTATAVAGHALRQHHTNWPIVGIEPAIKPAAQRTHTHAIGVLATQGTLNSDKYRSLRARVCAAHLSQFGSPLALHEVACNGLASAIEHLILQPQQQPDGISKLISTYLNALGHLGCNNQSIDTIVLGCTHYPLVTDQFKRQLPLNVNLVDPSERVAQHCFDVLTKEHLNSTTSTPLKNNLLLWSSGQPEQLSLAAQHWLSMTQTAQYLPV